MYFSKTVRREASEIKRNTYTNVNLRQGQNLATFHVESHGMILWCQVWAQLRHAPAPADRRPPAQQQPGLRRRRGPAHEHECLPCVQHTHNKYLDI